MKILNFLLIFILGFAIYCFSQDQSLVIDNFDGPIYGGAGATVDFGAGNGSSVEVTSDTHIKYSGNQSLKVVYNAVLGGNIWVARGYDLNAQKATWPMKPEDIDWSAYNSIAFYVYGSNSQADVAFDLKDNGNELFRFVFKDDFQGWKQAYCRFKDFDAREDWQPPGANRNAAIDFPIKSFQFEPLAPSQGALYFDCVELINK